MRPTALALALLMATTPAMAASKPVLAPGKAAGVRQAQLLGNNGLILLIGLGVLVAGIILITSNDDNSTTATTSTTP